MALLRLPPVLRGAPARLGAVVVLASCFGWGMWPAPQDARVPASLAMDGKRADRLAFSRDESEIPVREARIYDTIAMFAQPQAEPRPWSAQPIAATMQEAGIRPMPQRPLPRVAAIDAPRRPAEPQALPQGTRATRIDPSRVASRDDAEAEPVRLLGWDIPGSTHVPTRRDASRAVDKVGNGAVALGTGTVRVVSRAASVLGDGVMSAGNTIANTLRLD